MEFVKTPKSNEAAQARKMSLISPSIRIKKKQTPGSNRAVAWAPCPCAKIRQDMGRMPLQRELIHEKP